MSSQNFRHSFVPWLVAGRWFATPILVVAAALTACHKEPPHRTKRNRPRPAATAPAADDDSPPSPPPVPAAPLPAAAAAPPPPPPPPPLPADLPSPRPRHQLTVDRTDRTGPARPPRPLHAAAPGAAEPPPGPAAGEYQAVTDKPAPAASAAGHCEGGSVKGERLTVQGVAADDVLNVRESPDKASAILGELPHDATGIHGTANRRRVGASTWREVECGKLRGWVNERFLARETGQ